MDGSCFGTFALPVTVRDDFSDACQPDVSRSYLPTGGPVYHDHGDYDVTLTVMDRSGNAAEANVRFTIDSIAPQVKFLDAPGRQTLPASVPFSVLFESSDEDGAAGAVVHERVLLSTVEVTCPLFDGYLDGDGDGLLSDDTLRSEPAGQRATLGRGLRLRWERRRRSAACSRRLRAAIGRVRRVRWRPVGASSLGPRVSPPRGGAHGLGVSRGADHPVP